MYYLNNRRGLSFDSLCYSLYICGADESNSGKYSCQVQGFDDEIVQQNSIIIE